MSAMDYIFKLTDQTSGTVTLTSTPYAYVSGGVATASRDQATVSETMEFRLQDSAGTANLDEIHTLNRLLEQAEQAQVDRSIKPVYLTWQSGTGADVWRSEIIQGRAEPRSDALTYGYWSNDTMFAPVYLERRNYWEGAEVSLGGGTVTNVGTANYLDFAGTAIAGDLPGATRLEITNLDGDNRLYDVWIGHNWTDPTNAVQLYEAEAAVDETPTADATCSGGNKVVETLASGTETTLLTWAITADALSAAKGQWVHALVRFAPVSGDYYTWFRLKLTWNASTFWQSGQVKPTTDRAMQIRDLFQFRLPPGLNGLTGLDGMNLVLTGYQDSGSNRTLNFDFIALVPADGWRYLTCNGYGVAQNSRMIDDGINDYLYRDAGDGTGKAPILTGYGNPIKLYPGKAQRLYFWLHSVTINSAPITMSALVNVYYRPRRLSL